MDLDSPPSANGPADGAAPPVRRYTAEELKAAVLAKLTYSVGKNTVAASQRDWFLAVAFATRDIVVERWIDSTNAIYADDRKRVYYLSLEFLIGRMLFDAMTNLGIVEPMTRGAFATRPRSGDAAPRRIGRRARQRRPRPPGRLLHGQHGDPVDRRARLRHSLRQRPVPPDHPQRLAAGGSRGLADARQPLGIRAAGSQLRHRLRRLGGGGSPTARKTSHHVWHPDETVEAVGYDTPIVGWRGRHVNTLRLWSARAARSAEARRLQRRRLHRRADRQRARRGDLEGALSQRRDAGGPGIAAAAGIFLRLGFAARPRAPPRQAASATSARWPTTWRSSSTTRIRRSPSPS